MSEAVLVTQNEIVFHRNNNFVFMSLENTPEIQINLLDGDHQVKKTDNRVNSKSSGLAMHHFTLAGQLAEWNKQQTAICLMG